MLVGYGHLMWKVSNLPNKLNYISNILTDHNVNIFGVTETWLLPSITDVTVTIQGYNILSTQIQQVTHSNMV